MEGQERSADARRRARSRAGVVNHHRHRLGTEHCPVVTGNRADVASLVGRPDLQHVSAVGVVNLGDRHVAIAGPPLAVVDAVGVNRVERALGFNFGARTSGLPSLTLQAKSASPIGI